MDVVRANRETFRLLGSACPLKRSGSSRGSNILGEMLGGVLSEGEPCKHSQAAEQSNEGLHCSDSVKPCGQVSKILWSR